MRLTPIYFKFDADLILDETTLMKPRDSAISIDRARELVGSVAYIPPNCVIGVVELPAGMNEVALNLWHGDEIIASTSAGNPGAGEFPADARPCEAVFGFSLGPLAGRYFDKPLRVVDRATGLGVVGGELHSHLRSEENAASPWIPSLGLPEARRVLVVAPHPDDESLLFGGLILRYRAIGVAVTVVTLTDGQWDKQQGGSERRWSEHSKALELLNCGDSRRFDFADQQLSQLEDQAVDRLAGLIAELDPDLVVCPSPVDWHPDHIASAHIVDRACGAAGGTRLVAFGEFYALIKPNLVVDISEVAERKSLACSAYASQLELRPYGEVALGLNRYRALASESACDAAEAYCLVKQVGDESAVATFRARQEGKVLAEKLSVDWSAGMPEERRWSLPEAGELPDIDLSMVAYESADALYPFLKSLSEVDYPLEKLHLYFVDHSPDEGTLLALKGAAKRWAKRFGTFAFERRRNVGFGAGHNFNTWKGKSPYALIVNIDLTFKPDAFREVMRMALSAPENDVAWEFHQQPYEHPKIYDPVSLVVDWASAACLLLRRDAYTAEGGFDEAVFLYGEDTDLSYRIKRRGWQIRYCPWAVVYHHADDEEAERAQHRYILYSSLLLRVRYGTRADIVQGWRNLPEIKRLHERFGLAKGRLIRERFALLLSCIRFWAGNSKYRLPHKPSALRWFEDPEVLHKVKQIRKPGSDGSTGKRVVRRFKKYDFCFTRKGAYWRNDKLVPEGSPLVSVIIRSDGKRKGLLREALASIANQTYRNTEVLVVEDGGDSLSEAVTDARREAGLDVRLVPIGKSGRSVAGNVGLGLASGKFINFLDDDDLLFPDHIEVLVKELAAHPRAPAAYGWSLELPTVVACGYEPVYREAGPRHVHTVSFSRDKLKRYNYLPVQTVMFRSSLYRQYGGFDAELDALEDWDLWRRYAAGGDFICVPKSTSAYRVPGDKAEFDARQEKLNAFDNLVRERG